MSVQLLLPAMILRHACPHLKWTTVINHFWCLIPLYFFRCRHSDPEAPLVEDGRASQLVQSRGGLEGFFLMKLPARAVVD